MANVDLKGLSSTELSALIEQAQKELGTRQAQERQAAMDEIRKMASAAGLNVDFGNDTARGAVRKKTKSAPKYRDLNDPENTWTGRGPKPRWVKAHLEAGGSMEELAI